MYYNNTLKFLYENFYDKAYHPNQKQQFFQSTFSKSSHHTKILII